MRWKRLSKHFALGGIIMVMSALSQNARAQDSGDSWRIPSEKGRFHVFLLMGQSNMAGYGQLQPGDEKPIPGVLMLRGWKPKDYKWEPARHPIHNRLDSDQFSLAGPFAQAYRDAHPGVTVGLIPVAWGGAPISQLNKGRDAYADAIAKAKLAKERGVLKGVLWHQGESDTVEPGDAEAYAGRLKKLALDIRSDLGEPDLPFIAGNLAEFYGTGPEHNAPDRVARINQVRAVLRDLPNRVSHVAFVESAGLKSPDQYMVHFDRDSLIVFGRRYAAAYATMEMRQEPDRDKAQRPDWLLDGSPYKAGVYRGKRADEIILSNGLVRRTFRLAPNAATVGLDNLATGEAILRGVKPEAMVEIDGVRYEIGGLKGQPNYAFLRPEWIDDLKAAPAAFQFAGFEIGKPKERLGWKQVRHHAPNLKWPPEGVYLRMDYRMPAHTAGVLIGGAPQPSGMEPPALAARNAEMENERQVCVSVHYEMYDGLPVFSKWITVQNDGDRAITVNRFTSEILAAAEYGSAVESREYGVQAPNVHVDTDYAFASFNAEDANHQAVHWEADPDYETQVNYQRLTPCLLQVGPGIGPGQEIAPGGSFESFRAFVLPYDSYDRERNGLALRRMYRTIAPWITENPLMMHARFADWERVKLAIDQCAEVGFEMVILTFGSGFDIEDDSEQNLARARQLSEYARIKGIEIGTYSLLASRSVGGGNDVVMPAGKSPTFGNSPCIGSKWGQDYFRKLRQFYEKTGFLLLEHDGSYPGDVCAATDHPGHRGLEDSQWTQWRCISDFYKWCRANGVYLNVPDYYYLNGSNKCGMGYRETNWSLPREQQVIHTRQNIHDGTWEKTPSMGWMFVPLTEYHGGGAAATIEPLHEHLDHYEKMMVSNLGAGVQACYRGPRLYDTDETKAMVKKWVDWYKKHREILESDIIHLRRADGRDIDYFLHVNPAGKEKAMLVVFNPLGREVRKTVSVPLYYAGLTKRAKVSENGGRAGKYTLSRDNKIELEVAVPAGGAKWFVIE